MTLVVYDSVRREKVPFEPRDEGRATVYVCGPTVYDDAHVGHGRFATVFDMLNRWLRYRGYEVTFVMNITDVDDKIIERANREGVSPFAVADRYTYAWNRAMDALGVLAPDVQPHATAHIGEMQGLITRLIDAGHAYESDGNVLFRVRSFPDYGKLSGRRVEDAEQPADVAGEVQKEDPIDFALWKAAKPGEPSWPSPWGPGRPGWHIECSAMATRHLGPSFDIHGGGVDLIFPHHENEIAQHEAAYGEAFARTWLHNGMLQLSETKMSKSIGNVVGIERAVDRWGRGALRTWYASASYRSPLAFDEDLLDESASAFDRLVTFVRNARRAAGGAEPDEDAAAAYVRAFEEALDDDLNLPGGLAALHDAASAGNERLHAAERGDRDAAAALAALAAAVVGLGDGVLGLGIGDALRAADELAERVRPLVDELLERRAAARAERDFATADRLRDLLGEAGIVVEDRADGATWYLEHRAGRDGDEQLTPERATVEDEDAVLPTANI